MTAHRLIKAVAVVTAGSVQFTGCSTPAPPASTSHAVNAEATRRPLRKMGETKVRFSTDGSGRVVSVEILRSAGPELDANTVSYVRKMWRGPANVTKVVTFAYQMR